MRTLVLLSFLFALGTALGGCSSQASRNVPQQPAKAEPAPQREPRQEARKIRQVPVGSRVAGQAQKMLGVPYVYGGHTPRGFDCSGLVYYAYQQLGIKVPRTAALQLKRSTPIHMRQLKVGDLVFFRHKREPVSHVGIYLGDNRFIHAPSSGKKVSYGTIEEGYYKDHFYAGGRLHAE